MTDSLLPQRMFYELAPIYDRVGLSDYSLELAKNTLNFLQRTGWIGRYVLELGCGTGAAAQFLCDKRLHLTCVDASPEMIALTRQRLEQSRANAEVYHEDIRAFTSTREFDLTLAFNTVNYLGSVRDLATVFQRVNALLKTEKLFVFDIWTLEGLVSQFGRSAEIVYDTDAVFLARRNFFDYESQRLHQAYTAFYHQDEQWQRSTEDHILRGYPISALESMLGRSGFEVKHTLTPDMKPYAIGDDDPGHVVVIAEKVKDLNS